MRFVDIEDLHGNTWPVNPDQVCYLRKFGDNTQVVFGQGLNGLHMVNARGSLDEVRKKLETEPRRFMFPFPRIGAAMAPPPFADAFAEALDADDVEELAQHYADMRAQVSLDRLLEAGAEVAHAGPPRREKPVCVMTDDELGAELKRLGDEWDGLQADLAESGGSSGSPGEALIERIGELEAEQKRRAATANEAQTQSEPKPKRSKA